MPENGTVAAPAPLEPRLGQVTCADAAGVHRMGYYEWGDPDNERVLVCVHGLTRSGRDFDRLAQALQDHYRVVCPDVVGRGRSDWLADPAGYVVPQYVADMVTLLAQLRPARVDWVGTSMGGLIGFALAGVLAASPMLRPARGPWGLGPAADLPLGRMVFNDIGPVLGAAGLARIAEYVGEEKDFPSFQEAVAYVRATSEEFGPHSAADWEDLTSHVYHEQGGRWIKHYDLRIAQPLARQTPEDLTAAEQLLWKAWDHLPGPALVLRGARSDILSAETLAQMLARNPRASRVEFEGIGHAPTLRDRAQIGPIRDFLLAG